MINYINHDNGIKKLAQLLLEERLIPIFGAGFSKSSTSTCGTVPDGQECTKLMKSLILKYTSDLNESALSTYNFNTTASRFKKLVSKCIPENEYLKFFRNNFTGVKLSEIKKDFLQLPWPYIFTINIDDGIENTGLFNTILPYQNARKDFSSNKRTLFKLHGDAAYELRYTTENNIIFDSDQYTQSLVDPNNQTLCECFSNTYKEFNVLFIGCSLTNEPDIKYIYNSISKERLNTMGIILKKEKLSNFEEDDLVDYGITDIILVKDYDLFYVDLYNTVLNLQLERKGNNYPFSNPMVQYIDDNDLKYFSGYRSFDENKNLFCKSNLIIDRDALNELKQALQSYNIVFIEGRRFSGKTSLLCSLCEKEKRNTIFFFPSTTQEHADMIYNILSNHHDALLLFDSNSLSSECYYMLRDISKLLQTQNNKIVIALNQSDNYLPELIESDYIKLSSLFSKKELELLTRNTNCHGLIERKELHTNLDYLNIIKKEQGISLSLTLNLPTVYTKSEQILLLLLCVKDKIYSRDILSLHIKQSEISSFLDRVSFLCEWIPTAPGEASTYSSHKLVHNSKNIILEEIRKINHDDIVNSIITIVTSFKNGDNNQKRIYREVMQFDTLNQLFGRKKGAGKLIFTVYENLESRLSDDLHFWLQRSKSIYRLVPGKYWKLKTSYSYAKKVYLDSTNETLTTKAALSVSLICSLLFSLERNSSKQLELLEESIRLGNKAIFSEYYKQEKRLNNDLNSENEHNNYAELIRQSCSHYLLEIHEKSEITTMATAILKRLS